MKNILKSLPLLAALAMGAAGCQEKAIPVIPQTPVYPERPANTMVIYEANPRIFASSGALDAVSARLEEIQELGVNVLWLMPVHPVGTDAASVNSPYCVKDFKAVAESYGTVADLKELVTKAHSMDMKVILDWVANHTSWDNAWITDHKDWYVQDADGNITSPEAWPDVAELNFDNKDMRAAMIEAMKYWITETDIDGFRFDHVDGVPQDFWSEALTALHSQKSGLFMLAETSDLYYLTSGFDMLYGWNFKDNLSALFNGKVNLSELYASHTNEITGLSPEQSRMRYSTNHDQTSAASPINEYKSEAGAMAAFVAAAYMGGTPLIYSSQEVGYANALDFCKNDITIDWNSNPDYTAEYKAVMKAYKDSEPYRNGSPVLYQKGDVISFFYEGGLLVMINSTGAEIKVKMPLDHIGASVTDMISSANESIEESRTFGAYEYKIWKIEK